MKKEIRKDKEFCKQAGIPKHLRQYAKRYGVSVEVIAMTWAKYLK